MQNLSEKLNLDFFFVFSQLVVMVAVRKLMEYVFTERELKYLDDPMPEITLRKKEDAHKKIEQLAKVTLNRVCIYRLFFVIKVFPVFF